MSGINNTRIALMIMTIASTLIMVQGHYIFNPQSVISSSQVKGSLETGAAAVAPMMPAMSGTVEGPLETTVVSDTGVIPTETIVETPTSVVVDDKTGLVSGLPASTTVVESTGVETPVAASTTVVESTGVETPVAASTTVIESTGVDVPVATSSTLMETSSVKAPVAAAPATTVVESSSVKMPVHSQFIPGYKKSVTQSHHFLGHHPYSLVHHGVAAPYYVASGAAYVTGKSVKKNHHHQFYTHPVYYGPVF